MRSPHSADAHRCVLLSVFVFMHTCMDNGHSLLEGVTLGINMITTLCLHYTGCAGSAGVCDGLAHGLLAHCVCPLLAFATPYG